MSLTREQIESCRAAMQMYLAGLVVDGKPMGDQLCDMALASLSQHSESGERWVPFNVNDMVRVRLREGGREALREQRAKINAFLRKRNASGLQSDGPREDADGWSEWQLWCLMRDLGSEIHLGGNPPFETTIELKLRATNPGGDHALQPAQEPNSPSSLSAVESLDDHSSAGLVQWLRNQYSRHKEIEDKLAADYIEQSLSAVEQMREAAAKVCRNERIQATESIAFYHDAYNDACEDCERAIEALPLSPQPAIQSLTEGK